MATLRQKDAGGQRSRTSTQDVRVAQGQDFFRGLTSEFRRITWPSQREWVSATILTIVLVVGIGLFTFVVDQLCGWLFGLVHH